MVRACFCCAAILVSLTLHASAPPADHVVVLKDGTRYSLAKPYEVLGSQARLPLASGTLVSVRASEIDLEATKRASARPTPPPSLQPSASPASAEVGVASPSAVPTVPLGSRVKLDREKAGLLFRQQVVPTPEASGTGAEAATGADDKAATAFAEMMKADLEAETRWRDREKDRLARLSAAEDAQREICARYVAALNSAGTHDGYVSDAAGAILGALKADCDTASRRVGDVKAEREHLEEECRKSHGCQPGWLR